MCRKNLIVVCVALSLTNAACGDSISKAPESDDGSESSQTSDGAEPETDAAGCLPESRGSVQTDLYSADGSVEDFPEVVCTFLRNRRGEVIGFRAAFGDYDPADIDGPSAINRPEIEFEAQFYGYEGKVADDEATLTLWHLDEQGDRERDTGMLKFDPSTGEGSFEGRHELEFSCGRGPHLSNAEIQIPDAPAPGTAIVTLGIREHVYVVDGVQCERVEDQMLRIVTDDDACSAAFLELKPNSRQPLVGTGTYPEYFGYLSSIWVAFETRYDDQRNWAPGTLEVQGENPYRGFVTFATEASAPDRVEFHCPE